MSISTYDENTKWYFDTELKAFINDHVYGKRELVETNSMGVSTITPNPRCLLPPAGQLIEVSLAEYERLSAEVLENKGSLEVRDGKVCVTPPEASTFDQAASSWKNSVQGMMDSVAKQHGYTSLQIAVSYAEEPSVEKYQREGKAFRQWRSVVWKTFYETVDKYRETTPIPTVDQVLSQMPAFKLED